MDLCDRKLRRVPTRNNSCDQVIASSEASAADAHWWWNQIWGWDSSSQSFRSKIDDGRWWLCAHSPRMKSSSKESVFLSLVPWCFLEQQVHLLDPIFGSTVVNQHVVLLYAAFHHHKYVLFFHSLYWCEWSWRRNARRCIPHPDTSEKEKRRSWDLRRAFPRRLLLSRSITRPEMSFHFSWIISERDGRRGWPLVEATPTVMMIVIPEDSFHYLWLMIGSDCCLFKIYVNWMKVCQLLLTWGTLISTHLNLRKEIWI